MKNYKKYGLWLVSLLFGSNVYAETTITHKRAAEQVVFTAKLIASPCEIDWSHSHLRSDCIDARNVRYTVEFNTINSANISQLLPQNVGNTSISWLDKHNNKGLIFAYYN